MAEEVHDERVGGLVLLDLAIALMLPMLDPALDGPYYEHLSILYWIIQNKVSLT